MRNLACLVVFFLGTALAASAAFAASGGAGTRTDPCALVTPDEIADALGEPPGPPQNDGIGGCNYMGSKSGWETQAAISVDENPGRADFFDAQASQGNRLTIDDLGDRAFAFGLGAQAFSLTAIVLLGLLFLQREGLRLRSLAAERAASERQHASD